MTKRRCVIGCDSWAWAYLVKALRIDLSLPTPLVLAPLDGTQLQFWLPSLAFTNKGRFVFRDGVNGNLIFPMADRYDERLKQNSQPGQMERYGEWIGISPFLKQLAAIGRGLPQIIWLLWRESLQISTGVTDATMVHQAAAHEWFTIWVKPWSRLSLPIVPNTPGNEVSMLLHSMLIHNGATAELLDLLMPFSAGQMHRILCQLLDASLVERGQDGKWYVTLLAYPAVRHFLENEGYLVDMF